LRRISQQLEFLGLEETRRRVATEGATRRERDRLLRRVDVTHALMSELPTPDDLSFLHSGLCQTCLPHSRPISNIAVWRRSSGRFSLIVTPGVVDETPVSTRGRQPTPEEIERMYVGVPYGSKARLILIHLQTEGMRSRTVSLGPTLSAFLRSLGLPVSGGPRGSIQAIREQSLRIARCTFTMQWTDTDADGSERTLISDSKIVDGLELWRSARGEDWTGTVELSARFHEHLREHAVPLDKRGIAHLSGNSLGLDLYALFAYRLPRLPREVHLRWAHLKAQLGAELKETKELARRVREVMPDVVTAYPHANVEATSTGLVLRPSRPAVPKTTVRGFRLIQVG
jgi:replication initiator protein